MSLRPATLLTTLIVGAAAHGFLSAGTLLLAQDKSSEPQAASEKAPKKFGVYEVTLQGKGAVANPFDTAATVTFTPPSGSAKAKTVQAFYDGKDTWRARVYISEPGFWTWTSACQTDKGLDGKKGTFTAVDSPLRGRLLIHPKNPRQWITEDGRWFLNLNDTAYFLLGTHDAAGRPIPFRDFTAYVGDAAAHGITSVRCLAQNGPKVFLGKDSSDNHRWRDMFTDSEMTQFNLANFQGTDRRMQWLLDNYPDLYVQFILFPLGTPWGKDETFWKNMSASQKERLMRYMIARYAAYPQVFWLIVNDAHYGKNFPNNNALAREVGAFFKQHDPWQHPLSTGPARKIGFYLSEEPWASYVHLEDEYDLGAKAYEPFHKLAKPVFLGEDRYEQDRAERDPQDMRYFQRRLFWAWLLSGGSANYGGRWWVVHPYAQTGERPTTVPWAKGTRFTAPLTGLDSVPFIRDYFAKRKIELSDFEPDAALAADLNGRTETQAPKVMRRGQEEFLVYHPNAASDDKTARADAAKTARLRLNLTKAPGMFQVEWYRAKDGVAEAGDAVDGGREVELASPWAGEDVVVRLTKQR
jgi:hypothetical protein